MAEITAEYQKIFSEAAKLLETKGWTQREFARDENGQSVSWLSPLAASFCAAGACAKVADDLNTVVNEALNVLRIEVGGSIAAWNDDPRRTKDEVLAVLRNLAKEPT